MRRIVIDTIATLVYYCIKVRTIEAVQQLELCLPKYVLALLFVYVNRRTYNLDKIEILPIAVSQVYKPADTTNDSSNNFIVTNIVFVRELKEIP